MRAVDVCRGSNKPSMWRMRLGEHNLFEEDETEIYVPVERIFVHPLRAGKLFWYTTDLMDNSLTN